MIRFYNHERRRLVATLLREYRHSGPTPIARAGRLSNFRARAYALRWSTWWERNW